MTEAEWLACADPERMFRSGHLELSDRQQYLFAVAICRRISALLVSPDSLHALDLIEAFADGAAAPADLHLAAGTILENWFEFEDRSGYDAAHRHAVQAVIDAATRDDPAWWALHFATQAVRQRGTQGTVLPAVARLLRDIFGNPFRPVAVDPAWLTSDVLALARGIYEEKAFDRMPILADALQDAGCDSDEVLNHCRHERRHVRGCWMIDLLLGKG